jgi:hypothetical protein
MTSTPASSDDSFEVVVDSGQANLALSLDKQAMSRLAR